MEDTEDADITMLKKHVAELGEHFDSVRIFVTRHDMESGGGTIGCSRGCGNWYSQVGQIGEWVRQQDEQTRVNERNRED